MSTVAVIAMVGLLHDRALMEGIHERLVEENYKVVFIDHLPDKDLYVGEDELGFPWEALAPISEYIPGPYSDWIAPLERLPYPVRVTALAQPDDDMACRPLRTTRGGVGKGSHNPTLSF